MQSLWLPPIYLIRSIFSICICLTISGCVGIGAIAPTSHQAYLNINDRPLPISLQHDSKNTAREIGYSYGGGADKRYSEAEVMHAWGTPGEVTFSEPYTIWTYHEQKNLWRGIALHALVTIPLAIPTGKEKYTLFFKDNMLEKMLFQTNYTKLFVCDPAYMLIGGMAAGMSPLAKAPRPNSAAL